MSSLRAISPSVHSNLRSLVRIAALPELLIDEPGPFQPTLADEAWDLGYRLGRAGEDPRCQGRHEVAMAFLAGRHAGTIARETREAYELGFELGLIGGPSEPPSGFAEHEADAYRRGWRKGEKEAQDEVDREYYDRERYADACRVELTDADIWPLGCVS